MEPIENEKIKYVGILAHVLYFLDEKYICDKYPYICLRKFILYDMSNSFNSA